MRFRSIRPREHIERNSGRETVLRAVANRIADDVDDPGRSDGPIRGQHRARWECPRGLRRHERRDDTRRCRCPRFDIRFAAEIVPGQDDQAHAAGSANDVAFDDTVHIARQRHRMISRSRLESRQLRDRSVKELSRTTARARTPVAWRRCSRQDQPAPTGRRVHGEYRRPQDGQVHAALRRGCHWRPGHARVRPRRVTGSVVAISITLSGVPGGAMTTGPVRSPAASSVSPFVILSASRVRPWKHSESCHRRPPCRWLPGSSPPWRSHRRRRRRCDAAQEASSGGTACARHRLAGASKRREHHRRGRRHD